MRARTRTLELTGDLSRLQRAYDSVQQELGNNRCVGGRGGVGCVVLSKKGRKGRSWRTAVGGQEQHAYDSMLLDLGNNR